MSKREENLCSSEVSKAAVCKLGAGTARKGSGKSQPKKKRREGPVDRLEIFRPKRRHMSLK